MPKLPSISGQELVKLLMRDGFILMSQKGSHIKLRKGKTVVIVPNHREIRKGTLGNILRITNFRF